MITEQHIQFEAFKLHQSHPENTPEQNWEYAKEILKIWPDHIEPSPPSCNNSGYGGYKGYGAKLTADSPIWPGHFMVVTCRETFEKYLAMQSLQPNQPFQYTSNQNIIIDVSHMYFMDSAINVRKSAHLIRHLETEYLHLQELSKFSRSGELASNASHLIKIVFSPFWSQQTMRMSLFTLLLRAATKIANDSPAWSRDEIRAAINACGTAVSANVVDACMCFLSGNTTYTGHHDPIAGNKNWIATFQNSGNCSLLKAA